MKWIKILFLITFLYLFFPILSFAKDTDIYMASGEGVQPNILIIFDNSGSMNDEIPTRQYDKTVTYPGSALRDKVYRRSGWSWVLFGATEALSDIDDIPALCTAARNGLTDFNFATGVYTALNFSGTLCNQNIRDLRTGNYINFMSSGGTLPRTKLAIAKDTIKDLIDTVGDVKMGVMVFNPNVTDTSPHGVGGMWSGNNSHGGNIPTTPYDGRIESLTTTKKSTLKSLVTNITANTFTPLAETLYEAGLYFKGAASYFNNGVTYTSPIEYSCQQNYVIFMTDGNPTRDDGYSPYDNTPEDPAEPTNPASYDYQHPKEHNHILKRVVGDRDGDGKEPGLANEVIYDQVTETITADWWGTDYLDDVANYLYDTDLRLDLTGTQNIITYTIGFKITPQHNLLGRAAALGGGRYYTANDAAELADAFQIIVGEITEQTSSFVAPIVPVSRMEKESSGDKLYLALFQPYQYKVWSGNIKRFGVVQSGSNIGQIIDYNNSPALQSDGQIKDIATSHWPTDVPDGSDVEKGGVGKILKNRTAARNIYTYFGNPNLAHASNAFNTTNITRIMLGVSTDGERDNIVQYVHGYDVYYENESDPKGPTVKRDWILGSFLHSRPLVIHYGEAQPSYIFAGSNDGMLHAFNDDSGEEAWAFVPPNLLNSLQALHADVNATFVDGSPKAFIVRNSDGSMNQAILIFGQRRGGNRYYALDVTTPSSPQYLWEINPDATGSSYSEMGQLGQSWSTPNIGKIACQSGAPHCVSGERWVAFIGGGYDTNQDNNPVTTSDSRGRAVYVIDVIDGSLVRRFSHEDSPYSTTMTYSIPSDIARVDTDGDGKINRLYVGDMGGRMWRFDIYNPNPANWSGRIIFQSNPGNDSTTGRKIFYPPDVTLERDNYEMLIFGTGDREHPQEETIINRLYVVKDKNLAATILDENDLYDVTSGELQATGTTEERKAEILTALNLAYGWLIKLDAGEKSLSVPVVFYGTAYFTTFSPLSGGDPCFATFGTARMYALNYLNGNAVFNLDLSVDNVISTTDRSEIIGTAIPSGVIITFIQGNTVAYTGVGGGVDMPPLTTTRSLVPIYWRNVF